MHPAPPPEADAGRPPWAGAAEAALLAAALLAVHLSPPTIVGDGRERFEALDALLGRAEVPRVAYSLVGPLFSAPLWLLGHVALSPEWWCARYNLVLLAVALGAFEWLLRPALPPRPRRAFLLLVTFASMFPHHGRHYFGEVFTALLAGVGLAALAVRGAGWGWGCLVLAVANTPAALPGLGLVAAWRAWESRRGRYLLAPAAAAALVLLESYLRRGHPL